MIDIDELRQWKEACESNRRIIDAMSAVMDYAEGTLEGDDLALARKLKQMRDQWEVNWNNAADYDLICDAMAGKPIAPMPGSVAAEVERLRAEIAALRALLADVRDDVLDGASHESREEAKAYRIAQTARIDAFPAIIAALKAARAVVDAENAIRARPWDEEALESHRSAFCVLESALAAKDAGKGE